jgi:hypothetical protein
VYRLLLTNRPSGLRADVRCLFDLMRVDVARQPQIHHLSIATRSDHNDGKYFAKITFVQKFAYIMLQIWVSRRAGTIFG